MSGLVKPSNLPSWDEIEKVASLKNKGWTDAAVAKSTGLLRKEVKSLYQHYRELLVNDGEARDRAIDMLNVMIEQYDVLIKEHWELISKIRNESFDDKWSAQEAKVMAQVGDLIAKRMDMVQKAGILEATEMGDEYAEIEEKANLLISILRSDLCNDCRKRVQHKLQVATNQVEAVVVYPDEDM